MNVVSKRAGMMLIEVMLCVVIGIVLISVITSVLVRVLTVNPRAREHFETTSTLGRLAAQFRSDVHAAVDVTHPDEKRPAPRISLQGPDDERIEYETTAEGVLRTKFAGDQVRHRDQFALVGMKVSGWDVQPSKGEISLIVGRSTQRTADEGGTTRDEFPIIAQLARDRRFAQLSVKPNDDNPSEKPSSEPVP